MLVDGLLWRLLSARVCSPCIGTSAIVALRHCGTIMMMVPSKKQIVNSCQPNEKRIYASQAKKHAAREIQAFTRKCKFMDQEPIPV